MSLRGDGHYYDEGKEVFDDFKKFMFKIYDKEDR